jgi:hypothetical protein
MTVLFYAICKFSAMLTLLVAVPVCVESREIMILWLKTPPPAAAGLMIVVSISIVLEHLTMGHWMVISAKGRVALYQFLVGMCFCMSFPIGYLLLKCGCGVYSVGYTLVITYVGAVLVRLWTVNRLFGISPARWLCRIFIPLLATSVFSGAAGYCARMFLEASLARVAAAALFAEMVFVPMAWFWVLDRSEREWILNAVRRRLSRFAQ